MHCTIKVMDKSGYLMFLPIPNTQVPLAPNMLI